MKVKANAEMAVLFALRDHSSCTEIAVATGLARSGVASMLYSLQAKGLARHVGQLWERVDG